MSLSLAATTPGAAPNATELHARLEALLPLVEAKAGEAETLGYMTDEVVAALREAGIYTMLFPREVGGSELSHFEAMTTSLRRPRRASARMRSLSPLGPYTNAVSK